MAVAIARLYNDGGVGLLEAGTGVGKSLGYLVPALRWAAANSERTVVSTNTINLQEQLVGKDLPFLERALPDQKVRFALLKGWRNYLCLVRLVQKRWIKTEWGSSDNNRKAKFYSITKAGQKQLAAEARNWERISGTIGRLLLLDSKRER